MLKQRLKSFVQTWKFEIALFLTWGVYFIALFSRMMSIREDGLYLGHEYLWSDWASVHVGLANIFAFKPPQLWFAYHPVFADGKLTYPFLTNLISAFFMRAGFSVPFSFLFPSAVFALSLVFLMFKVFSLLLRSKPKAFVAIFIFFFSAGLGFMDYFKALLQKPGWEQLLTVKSKLSALESYDWLEGNLILGMLLPQRAFLLGMPLALVGLWVLFSFLEKKKVGVSGLICAGLLLGILPIAHMHSLIALTIVLLPVALASREDWRKLLYFALPLAALAASLFFIFISGGIQKKGFMSFAPGLSTHGVVDWVWFWWRAWGVMIPLALTGLIALWPACSKQVRAFFVGFFLLFAVSNVIQFQPTRWDNSKLFLWCYFGFSALAAHALSLIWSRGRLGRTAAVTLGFVLVFTGALQCFDLQRTQRHTYRLLTTDEMRIAEQVRAQTDPLARFATAFTHNHPIAVWGARPILLGYRAWVDNYGFAFQDVERDVTEIYQATARVAELLRKHRVSYVYFGPAEEREFHPNELYFKEHFPVAFSMGNGRERIYDVRSVSGVAIN